ncbi:MAG: HlyD family secretion protein [Isosphaeraceae bacterium]
MLTEAGWLVAPTVLFRTSLRATITAPLVAIRMPQQGQVQGTPPLVGSVVADGQQLFDVQTAPSDHRPLERIRGEIESVRKSAAALKDQIAELETLKAELSKHFSDYQNARIAQAEKQAAEQMARVSAASSRLKTAEFEHRMYQRLSIRGASSDGERARAEYALEEARNELDVVQQAASRQQLQLDAARRGFFVGEADGGQDRVASKQRCDEIEIQQAGLRSRLGELDGRLYELNARLASEEQYLAASTVSVVAPIGGVVWTSTIASGSEAAPGSTVMELIDPGQLCIQAVFRDADAERVRAGQSVKARLLGSSQVLSGQVIRVSDPGMIEQDIVNVAARSPVHPNTFLAIIRLSEQPTGGNADNRYFIGSSAIVWMPR